MNLDYFAGTPTTTHRTDLAGAIAWLTGIYGDHPGDVGRIDGTEDDFGDLVNADLPFVILGEVPDIEDERVADLEDRLTHGDLNWEQAINVAREILS